MAAPQSGETKRKFTNDQLLAVFDEYRLEHGLIELSAKEVTDILNEEILQETTVTRQAVSNRLNEMEGGEILRNKHGRSHLYYRKGDLEKINRDHAEKVVADGFPSAAYKMGTTVQNYINKNILAKTWEFWSSIVIIGFLGTLASGILTTWTSKITIVFGIVTFIAFSIAFITKRAELLGQSEKAIPPEYRNEN